MKTKREACEVIRETEQVAREVLHMPGGTEALAREYAAEAARLRELLHTLPE
jgi:hypothetical protein